MIAQERSASVLLYLGPTQPIPKKSQQIRTDKPRPHVCTICTRGFARLEHLKRHERSHTNEKPFQCAACGRCFARRDLVLRHQQKLHLHLSPVMAQAQSSLGLHVVQHRLLNAGLALESPSSSISDNSHIIILRNNTNAKAPLPHEPHTGEFTLQTLSPLQNDTPLPTKRLELPFEFTLHGTATLGFPNLKHASVGIMPLPDSTLNNNTPMGQGKASIGSLTSSLNPPNLDLHQQSPSTMAESPRSRRRSVQMIKEHHAQHRHASFLAVLGLSYTNVRDALSIQSHQIPAAPAQVGFATPQLMSSELDTRGLSLTDFGGLDLDWYKFDNNASATAAPGIIQEQLNQNATIPHINSAARGPRTSTFKLDLTTVPSELQMMQMNYFESDPSAVHNFADPGHPHHIKGMTPLDFHFNPGSDSFFPDQKLPVGTAFHDLAADLIDDKIDSKPAENKRPEKQKSAVVAKKQKTGFVNDAQNLSWVDEIKAIPILDEFPSASHSTGFLGMPYLGDDQNDIFSLFKSRQDDLVKQRSQFLLGDDQGSEHLASSSAPNKTTSKVSFTIGDDDGFITEELRDRVLLLSNMTSSSLPPLEDLNAYMALYDKEFDCYYPFIHMPTLRNPMVDNFENIPLILAMCAIGALYSYHDSNTLLLFNLSKYHIHSFFDKEVTFDKLQFKKVPIMAHQCLVLHLFISMFLNEPKMVEITTKQMNSMVGLIRSTNFHQPLEKFLVPPPAVTNPNDMAIIQNNFDYFIMTQTRIRTIHTFYQLQVFRTALLGCPLSMNGAEIRSGTPCDADILWKARDAKEWYAQYSKGEHLPLVDLSNNVSMTTLVEQLCDMDILAKHTLRKSFTLLMQVHETISTETFGKGDFDALNYRLKVRPRLEGMLRAWETNFARSGGHLVMSSQIRSLLGTSYEIKLILPLFSFARIRACVQITPVLKCVLHNDHEGALMALDRLQEDEDALKEAVEYSLDLLQMWAHNISALRNNQTSVRTPVFFVTCTFVAVVVLAKALKVMELSSSLSIADQALWSRSADMLKSIETLITSKTDAGNYTSLLRKHPLVFDFVKSNIFKDDDTAVVVDKNVEDQCPDRSIQALGLGVRILADAPLWPIALRFAEALKAIATSFKERKI